MIRKLVMSYPWAAPTARCARLFNAPGRGVFDRRDRPPWSVELYSFRWCLDRQQIGVDALELIVGKHLFPGRHSLRGPAIMHGGPEFCTHVVAIAVMQQAEIDPPFALHRVRAMAV